MERRRHVSPIVLVQAAKAISSGAALPVQLQIGRTSSLLEDSQRPPLPQRHLTSVFRVSSLEFHSEYTLKTTATTGWSYTLIHGDAQRFQLIQRRRSTTGHIAMHYSRTSPSKSSSPTRMARCRITTSSRTGSPNTASRMPVTTCRRSLASGSSGVGCRTKRRLSANLQPRCHFHPSIVDDHLLAPAIARSAPTDVVNSFYSGELFTTGSWYYRLGRALKNPETHGALSQ